MSTSKPKQVAPGVSAVTSKEFFASMNIRIAALVSLFSLIVALPIGILAGGRLEVQSMDALRTLQLELTNLAATQVEQPLKLGFSGTVEKRLNYVIDRAGDSFAWTKVIKSDGVVMADLGTLDDSAKATLEAEAAKALETGEFYASADGFSLVQPVTSKKGKIRGVLVMVWDPAPVQAKVTGALIRDALIALGLMVVSLGICFAILKRSLGNPMAQLVKALERIDSGKYDTRLSLSSRRDELGRMARRILTLQDTLRTGQQASQQREADQTELAHAIDLLRTGLGQLADQNLSARIEHRLSGTYEPLRADFNSAIASIAQAMDKVLGTAGQILTRSSNIESGAGNLNDRIQSQSETLEQISGALTQLTASVSAAAEGATHVNDLAHRAVTDARDNEQVVEKAIAAMTEIEESAGKIETIIAVIDDIAFQTNLLALNAGVEAARAGQAGAGFAVVASEVRALAQRTTDAATEVKALITNATSHIQNGVEEVNNTGAALTHVIASLGEISSRIEASAASFAHDSQKLSQLTGDLSELGQTTSNNATILQGQVSDVEALRGDAGSLNALVGEFSFGDAVPHSIDDTRDAA
ncbi:Ribose and galactose chemoreceptor protein [Tritonibacter multivorans]|uniref:Ribose and galactose chemoreceptor protein n=1 Tax=Tritonibacter multivorans TaxID=928856 RepID=A0A0P1GIT3_9RHOB|nr:methyl-accepting chemotaxis protein [Tritonibacter multivorans]MDA7420415.1 methyl-accepting chemotaxis protein [Tritonibacter multivorans]CUH81651.1 Ribose and galactose chemoreceptor protein [Tritonibacter multivorans]SFC40233.1 methyl-accepting chemotaxis protein [Tritonibacter multivorans]